MAGAASDCAELPDELDKESVGTSSADMGQDRLTQYDPLVEALVHKLVHNLVRPDVLTVTCGEVSTWSPGSCARAGRA